MSEVEFFMDRRDTTEFVQWLVETFGVTFVDDWSYELPLPRRTEASDVVATIFAPGNHSRFSLTHPDWTHHELVTRQVTPSRGSSSFYSLNQRCGGPSFDYIASRLSETDGSVPFIIAGSFSDYPTYFVHGASGVTVVRPPQMTALWKQVQGYLRRHGCRTISRELGFVGPYVLEHAADEHQKGIWLRSGDFHYEPRIRDRRTRR